MRTFDYLQQNEIIYNKRGLGYFVSENAAEFITEIRKRNFRKEVLPNMFKQMEQLNISIEEIIEEFKQYKTK